MQAYIIKLSMSSLHLKTVSPVFWIQFNPAKEYDVKILEQILWKMHEKNMFLLFLSSLESNYICIYIHRGGQK